MLLKLFTRRQIKLQIEIKKDLPDAEEDAAAMTSAATPSLNAVGVDFFADIIITKYNNYKTIYSRKNRINNNNKYTPKPEEDPHRLRAFLKFWPCLGGDALSSSSSFLTASA